MASEKEKQSERKMKLSSTQIQCKMYVSKLIFALHLSPLIPLSIHKSQAKTRFIRKCINHKMFAYTKEATTFPKCPVYIALTFTHRKV